jgi:hypothetical protein
MDKHIEELSKPVAEINSKYGDPEAFGERELKVLADIQKMPYRTKFYSQEYVDSLLAKLEAAERALIRPLPIGELIHRLEGQTYEKWFSESDVKDLRERAEAAEAALSAANEKLKGERVPVAWSVGGWLTFDKKFAESRSNEDNLQLEPLYRHPIITGIDENHYDPGLEPGLYVAEIMTKGGAACINGRFAEPVSAKQVELVTADTITEIMQEEWNEWCSDTGCFPDDFEWKGGNGTLSYEASRWSNRVADRIVKLHSASNPVEGGE